MIPTITASDLEVWADRRQRQAQELLPRLLRWLIRGTIVDYRNLSFPAGDSIQYEGWDGTVSVDIGNAYVPDGKSIWEFGCNNRVVQKATSDYAKRTKDRSIKRKEHTFLFVTPRRWTRRTKAPWMALRKRRGAWADVRVIDADDLEHRLEEAPAVAAWFGAAIGHSVPGSMALRDFWEVWRSSVAPALPSKLLVVDRKEQVDRLSAWLDGPPGILTVQGDTMEEATAFVAAAAYSWESGKGENVLARSMVIRTADAWESAVRYRNRPLILIPQIPIADLHLDPSLPHHIIAARTELSSSGIRLTAPTSLSIRDVLKQAGLPENRAARASESSGRRITILRRILSDDARVAPPGWARSSVAVNLAAIALIGSWDERNSFDQAFVEHVVGIPYAEVQRLLTSWLAEPDSPVEKLGNVWQLSSRRDAWRWLEGLLTSGHLQRFEERVLELLTERDPRFDLSVKERSSAPLYGKVRKSSAKLYQSVADTLPLVATFGTRGAPVYGSSLPDQRVQWIIRTLFEGSDQPDFWPAMDPILRAIAEAAPQAFLAAVERDLAKSPTPLRASFVEEDGTFGRCLHCGILWALEALAWDPRHLAKVCQLLAGLDQIDPGGRWSNRPFNSLHHIFCLWYPQSAGTSPDRLTIVDSLIRSHPEVAWKLLLALVGERHSAVSQTHRPDWREWVLDLPARPAITRHDFQEATDQCADRLLKTAGNDVGRLKALLGVLPNCKPGRRTEIIDALSTRLGETLTDSDANQLRLALMKIVHQHRRFSDAQWALPALVVNHLEGLLPLVEPRDPVARLSPLFRMTPTIPEIAEKDWRKEREKLDSIQVDAAKQARDLGLEVCLALASAAEHPHILGDAIARTEPSREFEQGLLLRGLGSDTDRIRTMVAAYIGGRFREKGVAWISNYLPSGFLSSASAEAKAHFIRGVYQADAVLKLLDAADSDTRTLFWETCSIYAFGSPDHAEAAIEKLLTAGRPLDALEVCMSLLHSHAATKLPSPVIVRLLEAVMHVREEDIRTHDAGMLAYNVDEILKTLQESGDLTDDDLFRLEWSFAPLFRFEGRKNSAMTKAIARRPELFVEMLGVIYLPKDTDKASRPTPTEEETLRASLAYDVLRNWVTLPGLDGTSLDGSALRAWVEAARALAAEHGYADIADDYIGQYLTGSPVGADGAWPHEAVRDLLETVPSDSIRDGFRIGIINGRGVFTKSLNEGGAQEHALAEKYRSYAAALQWKWPTTSAQLEQIAVNYLGDALTEDQSQRLRD